jgi:hypothetical protein
MNRAVRITSTQAEEIRNVLQVVADSADLQQDCGLTEQQVTDLLAALPRAAGEWVVPDYAASALKDELAARADVLRTISDDARAGGQVGQALAAARLAASLERLL